MKKPTNSAPSTLLPLAVIALALVGLVLIAVSFVLDGRSIAARSWSRADAEAFTQSGLEAKKLAHLKSHGQGVTAEQAQQGLQAHQAYRERLDQAKQRGQWWVTSLRWLGVGSTALAFVLHLVRQQAAHS